MTREGQLSAPPQAPQAGREGLLRRRLWVVVLAVISVGLLLRILGAVPLALNPDEAYNSLASHQSTLSAAIREGMTVNPHPPLYYILLYFWLKLGTGDLWLRLLSVIPSAAALVFFWLWLRRQFNETTALVGVTLFAFATEAIVLAGELRDYSLLVLFLCAALYVLEQALSRVSPWLAGLHALLLGCAVLTDYSALWAVIALGVYSFIRGLRRRPSRTFWSVWLAGQTGLLGTALYLYRASVVQVHGTEFESWVRDVMLRKWYFHPGEERLWYFPVKATLGLMQYTFTWRAAPWVALALMLLGLALIIARGVRGNPGPPARLPALLLGLPFVLVCAAALAGRFPYGGSRHSYFLVPFVLAIVAYAVSELCRRRTRIVIAVLLLLVPTWKLLGRPTPGWFHWRSQQRRELLLAGLSAIRASVPKGGLLYSDTQTQLMLRHYLGDRRVDIDSDRLGYTEYACGNWRSVAMLAWGCAADSFVREYRRMTEVYGLRPRDTVWVFASGWGENVGARIKRDLDLPVAGLREYGRNVCLFPVVVGRDLLASAQLEERDSVFSALAALTGRVGRQLRGRYRWVFWPSLLLPDSTAAARLGLPGPAFAYSDLYLRINANGQELDEFLPALALWSARSRERHLNAVGYMREFENYVAGGYRFTLLAVDPATASAVYLVEPHDAD